MRAHARRAITTSRSSRRPRRGHAAELAARRGAPTASTWSSVLAGDGTLNEAADGLVGTHDRARAAARRVDQRVRPHARDRRRPGRRDRRSSLALARRRLDPARSASGDGERPPLPLPPRRRLRRRGRRAGRAARSTLKRYVAHPAVRGRGRRHLAPRLRPRARPRLARRRSTAGDADRAAGSYAVVSNAEPVHLRRRRAASIVAPTPALDRALGAHACSPTRRAPHARRAARLGASASRPAARDAHPTIVQRADVDALADHAPTGPFPWQVDGDYLGERRAARGRATSPTRSRSSSRRLTPTRCSATSGTSVMTRVDAGGGEPRDLVGVVHRPHVDLRRRRSCGARHDAGRDARRERPDVGVQRARDRARRASRARRADRARTTRKPVGTSGVERRGPGRPSARWNDETSTSVGGRRARRGARRRASAARSVGSKSASPGEFLISTFTSVPAHTSSTSARVGTSGRAAADLGQRRARPSTPSRARRRRGGRRAPPSAVRWTSSSTPSAPELERPRERREGVLRRRAVGAAVGEHERSRPGAMPTADRRHVRPRRARNSWSGPLCRRSHGFIVSGRRLEAARPGDACERAHERRSTRTSDRTGGTRWH